MKFISLKISMLLNLKTFGFKLWPGAGTGETTVP